MRLLGYQPAAKQPVTPGGLVNQTGPGSKDWRSGSNSDPPSPQPTGSASRPHSQPSPVSWSKAPMIRLSALTTVVRLEAKPCPKVGAREVLAGQQMCCTILPWLVFDIWSMHVKIYFLLYTLKTHFCEKPFKKSFMRDRRDS